MKWSVKTAALVASLSASLIGFAVGSMLGDLVRAHVECCAEGEICEDEEEWSGVLLDATIDEAAVKELGRMVNDCRQERNAALLDSTAAALVLEQCREKLKPYELDAPP